MERVERRLHTALLFLHSLFQVPRSSRVMEERVAIQTVLTSNAVEDFLNGYPYRVGRPAVTVLQSDSFSKAWEIAHVHVIHCICVLILDSLSKSRREGEDERNVVVLSQPS